MNELRNERAGGLKNRWRLMPLVAKRLCYLLIAMIVALSVLAAPALADDDGDDDAGTGPVGAVYVASNAEGGNETLTFFRFPDGSLAPGGPGVPTGGSGSGPDPFPPLRDDPLGSQDSLVVDQDNQLLFAVNAGSDDISVFAIEPDGLSLVDRHPSHGAFPVGAAVRDDTLYVLNAVGNSIAGFEVEDDGGLEHIQTCQLPDLPDGADGLITQTPGQVGFSPDGERLVVVSKEGLVLENFPTITLGNGRIHVYEVGDEGTLENCRNPTTTILSSNSSGGGKFPFSFTWSQHGHLLLTEVFGTGTSLAGGAVSSFALGDDGSLTPISESVGNYQGVTCWIVRSGSHAYVANFFTDNISSYEVDSDGQVTLSESEAATFGPGQTQEAIDMAVTDDGRFVYQLTPGSATIRPFEVDPTSGELTALTPVADGLNPHSGQAGIATVDFDD